MNTPLQDLKKTVEIALTQLKDDKRPTVIGMREAYEGIKAEIDRAMPDEKKHFTNTYRAGLQKGCEVMTDDTIEAEHIETTSFDEDFFKRQYY